ncbi:MAG TPA: hypothetical protein VFI39_02620 [Gemmatimonadales bacterium]|nr:hypothetical protein [Gemmatimonadales bacterium]
MQVVGGSLLALVLLAPAVGAQRAPARQRGALVQRIEDLFVQRVTDELGLSPVQAQRLRGTALRMFARRRAMETESRRLDQLLARQLRPGVAADPDSVTRLTDSLLVIRVNYARLGQEEMAELRAYLSPVQSAQYYVLRERLLQRIQNARRAPVAGGANEIPADPGS